MFIIEKKKIKLSYSVKSIGEYAFVHCSPLEEILISSSVAECGYIPFNGCSSLHFFI